MNIQKKVFGTLANGHDVHEWTLSNKQGMSVTIMEYGATVTAINIPDKNNVIDNVVLSYPTLKQYEACQFYLGVTIGRVAGRIHQGRFSLDGADYQLDLNDNETNHLHGGKRGWSKQLWDVTPFDCENSIGLVCKYTCVEYDDGYPGNVQAEIRFTLNQENTLGIEYSAKTDKATPINLTNHSYFNLLGDKSSRDIMTHKLLLNADQFAEFDQLGMPTGEYLKVAGTPFDFSQMHSIGERVFHKHSQFGDVTGYDHAYVVNKEPDQCSATSRSIDDRSLHQVAYVNEETTGRSLTINTNQAAVVLYTGNYFAGNDKTSNEWHQHAGLCLETQYLPDSPNHSNFPSVIYTPKRDYYQLTEYRFDII